MKASKNYMNNIRALVTGGSGYYGSHLLQILSANKSIKLGSLDINPPLEINDNIKFHKADIRDKTLLSKIIPEYDIIFHNIAQVPLAKNNSLFWDVNVEGTKNICNISLECGIKRLIYTSSSAIYGVPKSNPVSENTKPFPKEAYGVAKLEGEKICFEYSKLGLPVTIIRPRTILGHGRLGIFSILFSWIEQGVNIPVLNNGKNIYQFIHSDDLANATILSVKTKENFNSYNIGSENFGTMRDALENLCQYANTGSKVYSLPMKPIEIIMNITSKLNLTPLAPYHALMYGRSLYFDISKAKKELGFLPKYSTDEMLQQSYNWYINEKSKTDFKDDKSIHQKSIQENLLKIFRIYKG